MRERNPPRNSQLETHRTDEAEGGPEGAAPAQNSSADSLRPLQLVPLSTS
jgi:hypothetical protein